MQTYQIILIVVLLIIILYVYFGIIIEPFFEEESEETMPVSKQDTTSKQTKKDLLKSIMSQYDELSSFLESTEVYFQKIEDMTLFKLKIINLFLKLSDLPVKIRISTLQSFQNDRIYYKITDGKIYYCDYGLMNRLGEIKTSDKEFKKNLLRWSFTTFEKIMQEILQGDDFENARKYLNELDEEYLLFTKWQKFHQFLESQKTTKSSNKINIDPRSNITTTYFVEDYNADTKTILNPTLRWVWDKNEEQNKNK